MCRMDVDNIHLGFQREALPTLRGVGVKVRHSIFDRCENALRERARALCAQRDRRVARSGESRRASRFRCSSALCVLDSRSSARSSADASDRFAQRIEDNATRRDCFGCGSDVGRAWPRGSVGRRGFRRGRGESWHGASSPGRTERMGTERAEARVASVSRGARSSPLRARRCLAG